jgi:hypothetical protein
MGFSNKRRIYLIKILFAYSYCCIFNIKNIQQITNTYYAWMLRMSIKEVMNCFFIELKA